MQDAASTGGVFGAIASPAVAGKRASLQGVVLGVAVALLLFLVGYPLLWLILAAFGLPHEFGLDAFNRAFTRPQNYTALVNTLQLAFGTGAMSILIGVPLAWAGARTDMKLRGVVPSFLSVT